MELCIRVVAFAFLEMIWLIVGGIRFLYYSVCSFLAFAICVLKRQASPQPRIYFVWPSSN